NEKIFRCVPAIEKNSKHVLWESAISQGHASGIFKKTQTQSWGTDIKAIIKILLNFKNNV
ncbi:MAG TPA: hypothetical protein PK771_04415, partial [Spirochaetota bacterium]|nr:hypothetical protein [Spirochaetota bacterium]